MKLYEELGAEFIKSLKAVFEREHEEDGKDGKPNYLKQTILGCRWRAFKGLTIAFIQCLPTIVNMGGLSIAKHRQEVHGDNKTRTISSITKKLTEAQVERATTSTGWMV